jgi:arylformamidase
MGDTVYREFDQDALDAQYNCRGMVPDFEDHMTRWVGLAKQVFDSFETRADLAYGPRPAEKLDLFLPEGPGPHPLMIFIHGGYWRAMDKDVHAFPALSFVPDGIALASINYTLAPEADMDEIVRECRAAVAWCAENAAELNIDADRIHVSGHSAGGHLTAMMLATDWPAFQPGLAPDLVKSGVPISGLYDLEPIRWTYLNEDVRLTEDLAARNSPVRLTPKGPGAMVVAAGGIESGEFHRLQSELVAAWQPHIPDIEEIAMPGLHHFNVVTALGEADSPLYQAARRRILG